MSSGDFALQKAFGIPVFISAIAAAGFVRNSYRATCWIAVIRLEGVGSTRQPKWARVCSRLSLFRLPELRPPRYTGHLALHGMLAICLLHKTHPEVRPLAIPFTGQCWLHEGFQCNFIPVLRPDMTFWMWFNK